VKKHLKFVVMLIIFGLMGAPSFAQTTTLRLAWWGGDARHEMYNRLADMYQQENPNIRLEREFAGWDPYWERLATQTAGGNAPDILHMHQVFLAEYASRGVLMNLQPLIEAGTIDLSDFPQAIIDTGNYGDGIYMITLGNSAPGTHYNVRLFEEAGVEVPDFDWTWDDFERIVVELSDALGPNVYGVNDAGYWDQTLELFMRQQGKRFFDGGELGFDRDDLIEYWSMWERLRQAGAIPPADLTSEYAGVSHADSMLVRGTIAMQMMSGNQHKLYQDQTEDELGLTTLPRSSDPDAPSGDTVGGAYISISARTQHPEAAAAFVNWFVNDVEVARIYNNEHGPVGSETVQAVLSEQLDPADQRLAQMMNFVSQRVEPADDRPPRAGEVVAAFTRIYEELAFGRFASVEAAVDAFFDEADFILF
jgi:multiple sugar transport system substrate-binding protein